MTSWYLDGNNLGTSRRDRSFLQKPEDLIRRVDVHLYVYVGMICTS